MASAFPHGGVTVLPCHGIGLRVVPARSTGLSAGACRRRLSAGAALGYRVAHAE
ncbi:hypothetical protein ACFSEO_08865 [Agromyces cerinus subsp. nitratus]|uniref:hypothetical protein n=1 Tax=Agromyces cerinus TaxID=33878 RepID=UPI00362EF1B9